jgi:hypothetical protein
MVAYALASQAQVTEMHQLTFELMQLGYDQPYIEVAAKATLQHPPPDAIDLTFRQAENILIHMRVLAWRPCKTKTSGRLQLLV